MILYAQPAATTILQGHSQNKICLAYLKLTSGQQLNAMPCTKPAVARPFCLKHKKRKFKYCLHYILKGLRSVTCEHISGHQSAYVSVPCLSLVLLRL